MNINLVNSNEQVQKLIIEVTKIINSSDKPEQVSFIYHRCPFYSLVKESFYASLYRMLKDLDDRLIMYGSKEDSIRNQLFHEDFGKEPEKYVRYIIEDAINTLFNRKVGQQETKLLTPAMKKTDGTVFRAFFHRVLYFTGTKLIKRFVSLVMGHPEDEGIIAYGYIDKQAGLSYKAICSARIENNQILCGELSKDTTFTIRAESLAGSQYIDILDTNLDMYEFERTIDMARDYDTKNKDLEAMREYKDLDPSRHPEYPDDLNLYLINNGCIVERIWIRCEKYAADKNMLYGRLLNEPDLKCGYHINEIIPFRICNNTEGIPICIYQDTYK